MLQAIKDKFTAINLKLKDTNISASSKVIYLQETLANERDALYNIQTYLAVPFALRSCQCVNLTTAAKEQLETQIKNAQKSIGQLQHSINFDNDGSPYENPLCPGGKCAAVQTVKQ